MLEAAGYKTHVYTSPHLVRFHERIRLAGHLIEEEELVDILSLCERLALPHGVSYFEAATAAAFVAFARHKADFTILETGLGGRLDATNVIEKPLATIITRLSYDHRDYLGDTLDKIAREKAGIMRSHVPCFVAAQPAAIALQALRDAATAIDAPLSVGGIDWESEDRAGRFHYRDAVRSQDFPPPGLLGLHQYQNAGLAIAALATLPKPLPQAAIVRGLATVEWPARLQRLTQGPLMAGLPDKAQLWLDGGHNDSAGEVLALQIERWRAEDKNHPRALCVVLGMLTTKNPVEFLAPFASYITRLAAVAIPDEPLSFTPAALAHEARKLGIVAQEAENVTMAVRDLAAQAKSQRLLICGSLYLAGSVLGMGEER
jgi:dihydrofolate synthase/folylpolyglutamate synthase